jgi:hypothetical protein
MSQASQLCFPLGSQSTCFILNSPFFSLAFHRLRKINSCNLYLLMVVFDSFRGERKYQLLSGKGGYYEKEHILFIDPHPGSSC